MRTSKLYPYEIIDFMWRSDADGNMPSVVAVLDGAQDKRIEPLLNNSGAEHDCLYSGQISYALKRAAPHAVVLSKGDDFTRKLLENAWGNNWGIFAIIYSKTDIAKIRHNFRKHARVVGPNGKKSTFRYYDPRILAPFLPACNYQELAQFFGPVDSFVVEASGGRDINRYHFNAEKSELEKESLKRDSTQKMNLTRQHAADTNAFNGYFVLRQEHMDAFNSAKLKRQFQEIYQQYLSVYEPKLEPGYIIDSQTFTPVAFYFKCFKVALSLNFTLNTEIIRFFHYVNRYRWGFWFEPEIQKILCSSYSSQMKLQMLDQELMERLGEII